MLQLVLKSQVLQESEEREKLKCQHHPENDFQIPHKYRCTNIVILLKLVIKIYFFNNYCIYVQYCGVPEKIYTHPMEEEEAKYEAKLKLWQTERTEQHVVSHEHLDTFMQMAIITKGYHFL